MKTPNQLIALLSALFLTLAFSCFPDEPIVIDPEPECSGGYFMELYEKNPFTGELTRLSDDTDLIFVGTTVVFRSDYSGPGSASWSVDGPCGFEPGTQEIAFGEYCTGTYRVRFEYTESDRKYCDEVSFSVTSFGSDTMYIDGAPLLSSH